MKDSPASSSAFSLTNRARDSTLRAAALTSTKSLQIYLPSLLKNVTISIYSIPGFYQMLQRDTNGLGRTVQSLHIEYIDDPYEVEEGVRHEAHSFWIALSDVSPFPQGPNAQLSLSMFQTSLGQSREKAAQTIYHALKNLETLILEDPALIFSFQLRINGKLVQHQFLINSLKKLYVLRSNAPSHNRYDLSAINSIWLLLFLPHLKEAALGVSITTEDLKLLSELNEAFTGLSNVEKLALDLRFDWVEEDRRTWWGVAGESSQILSGENKKTEVVHRMLSVLNPRVFQCLELFNNLGDVSQRRGDETHLTSSCFLRLDKSFRLVKHLRLIGFGCGRNSSPSNCFLCLESLRILSLDYYALFTFVHFKRQLLLPTNIEIICLPFYSPRKIEENTTSHEEKLLADFLESNALPNLKEVIIPSNRIGGDGKPVETQHEKVWTQSRRALERLEIFRCVKVRMRMVQAGEKSQCSEWFLKKRIFLVDGRLTSPHFTSLCLVFYPSQLAILRTEKHSSLRYDGCHHEKQDKIVEDRQAMGFGNMSWNSKKIRNGREATR